MAKFYTQTGDDGYTSQLGEGRVAKDSPQVEAVGAVDEATAALGLLRSLAVAAQTAELVITIQRDLYHLMAELAAAPENASRFRVIDSGRVTWLDEQVDNLTSLVSLPKEFILPGDSSSGAAAALARTGVRRAERRVVPLVHGGQVQNIQLLRYLNRLSSLLFVVELLENQAAGKSTPSKAKGERDQP